MSRFSSIAICILSLLCGWIIVVHKDARLYNDSIQSLSAYFSENRTYENKNEIFWVELTDRMIPIISESFDDVVNFSESYFSLPLLINGYAPSWEIHDLRLVDDCVEEIAFFPVFTSSPKNELNHFDEIVFSSIESPLGDVIMASSNRYYSLRQTITPHCGAPHYSVVDDFGYYGIFGDSNRGLAEEVMLGVYSIVETDNLARCKDFVVFSICLALFFSLLFSVLKKIVK